MAIHHLTLPSFIEPPPRIPVVARHCGPVLAAMRRHGVYRFIAEAPAPGAGSSWMERAVRRR